MIWIYVVVITLTAPVTPSSSFTVHAPNMAFRTEEACQSWREFDMLRLYNTRPDENAKAVSQCFSMPFNIDKAS
tara:strand:+ start:813 stop:1034 length:222 start_codon:yes stop_codon:yes gene_type:complete